jgi:MFS family permease
VATEPLMTVSFLAALVALALTSANSPNWFALITEVNPPEHRGTVYSLGNLVNGVGRAAGNALVGQTFARLAQALPPPANFATGLALFQVFFVPTGIMYWLASRTAGRDTEDVTELLRTRSGDHGAVQPLAEPQERPARLVGSHVDVVGDRADDL